LASASKVVHDTSTKLALVLKESKCTPEGAASICDAFARALEVLATVLTVLCRARPCKLLWHEAHKAVQALVSASCALVAAIVRDGPESDAATQAVGVVWALSENPFKMLPKSNRVAYRRALMKQSVVVKETIEEFEEIYALGADSDDDDDDGDDGDEGGKDSSGAGGGGKDFDDFEDFLNGDDKERYSAKDMVLARACLDAAAIVRPTFKTTLDAFDTFAATATPPPTAEPTPSPTDKNAAASETATPDGDGSKGAGSNGASNGGDGGSSSDLGRVGLVWGLCEGLVTATTSLGAALYPPLLHREVREGAEALLAAGNALASELAAANVVNAVGSDDKAAGQPTAAGAEHQRVVKVWAGVATKLNAALDTATEE